MKSPPKPQEVEDAVAELAVELIVVFKAEFALVALMAALLELVEKAELETDVA